MCDVRVYLNSFCSKNLPVFPAEHLLVKVGVGGRRCERHAIIMIGKTMLCAVVYNFCKVLSGDLVKAGDVCCQGGCLNPFMPDAA